MPFKIYSFIFLLFGAFLIWRSFLVLHLFGWLLISLVTYYQFRWVSPLFVTRGRRLVKIFNLAQLGEIKYASIRSPHWLDTANSLLFIPDEKVFFPDSKNAFVLELETQQTHWKPMNEVNLDEVKPLAHLSPGYTEQQDDVSINYASPSKEGLRIECSTSGFSLPIISYYFAFPCGSSHGWRWTKRYFTWKRAVVRSTSTSVLVELNKIIFNVDEWQYDSRVTSAWVMDGKFLVIHADKHVFGLGSFNPTTSIPQTTAINP